MTMPNLKRVEKYNPSKCLEEENKTYLMNINDYLIWHSPSLAVHVWLKEREINKLNGDF